MNEYLQLEVLFLFISGIFCLKYKKLNLNKKDSHNLRLYIVIIFIILTLFMGLRGDYATDYNSYKSMFLRVNPTDFSQEGELGFRLIALVLRQFTANHIYFFVLIAGLTTGGFLKFFKEHSAMVWLSILMLLCVGSFFTSANAMRNIFAAGLYVNTIGFIEQKNFSKYAFTVLLISTIHLSAIVLIPVYFFITIEWNKKLIKILLIAFLLLSSVLAINAKQISQYAMTFIYSDYGYGVDYGLSFVSIVKVVVVEGFILLNIKKINFNYVAEKALFNSSLLYLTIYLCAMNVAIIQRFAYYFEAAPFALIPLIISRIKRKKTRLFTIICAIVLLLSYSYMSVGKDQFTWFWQ